MRLREFIENQIAVSGMHNAALNTFVTHSDYDKAQKFEKTLQNLNIHYKLAKDDKETLEIFSANNKNVSEEMVNFFKTNSNKIFVINVVERRVKLLLTSIGWNPFGSTPQITDKMYFRDITIKFLDVKTELGHKPCLVFVE